MVSDFLSWVNYQQYYVKTEFLSYDKSTLSNEKSCEKLPATMAASSVIPRKKVSEPNENQVHSEQNASAWKNPGVKREGSWELGNRYWIIIIWYWILIGIR